MPVAPKNDMCVVIVQKFGEFCKYLKMVIPRVPAVSAAIQANNKEILSLPPFIRCLSNIVISR